MKRFFSYISILLILVSILISCSQDEDLPNETTENDTAVEMLSESTPVETLNENGTNAVEANEITITDEILRLVNQHRQQLGLNPLTKNKTAEQLAIDHTAYMIARGEIGHDNFQLRFDHLKANENARGASENVASRYPDAQSVMNGWLESKGHKDNIEGNYTQIGIAAIKNNRGQYYFTQLFFR